MSYLVTVSFDIENASAEQYNQVEEKLSEIGFSNEIIGNSNKEVKLPNNTFAGEFDGANASKVRDDLSDMIRGIFSSLELKAKIFVHVGGNWAWGSRNT